MTRYEIVAHLEHDLASDSPEEAAVTIRQRLGADQPGVSIRHLAVWRLDTEAVDQNGTAPLRQRLAEFFAEVKRCASAEEARFRARVAVILAGEPGDLVAPTANPLGGACTTSPREEGIADTV